MQTTPRVIGLAIFALACSSPAQEFRPVIQRAWDDSAVKDFELPLAQRDRSPRYMSEVEYYNLKYDPYTARIRFMFGARSRRDTSNG
jgi:hypothetical protein